MSTAAAELETVELQQQPLRFGITGSGRNILFLSSALWFAPDDAFSQTLGQLGRVTTPIHPGFSGGPIAAHLTNADDLAYLYLDLIETKLKASDGNVVIVAGSFGAFVAAQMAVKSCERIAGLVLMDPAGVKAGGRSDRDFVDLFAHPDADLVNWAFAAPEPHHVNLREVPEHIVTARVNAREALARYAWQPFMHDPKLPARLHRVSVPTLVLYGARDRILSRPCAELYAHRLPTGQLKVIDNAGHLPHVEQPESTLAAIGSFLDALPR